ncbi:MAG: hypothetical protein A2X59_10090 [Nitrospirae bacterium GWC2_42_7]|nr:MAG: hypothetical protein A2X59_10090 [Nitrospirae bacterium GWC2_42_7]
MFISIITLFVTPAWPESFFKMIPDKREPICAIDSQRGMKTSPSPLSPPLKGGESIDSLAPWGRGLG